MHLSPDCWWPTAHWQPSRPDAASSLQTEFSPQLSAAQSGSSGELIHERGVTTLERSYYIREESIH